MLQIKENKPIQQVLFYRHTVKVQRNGVCTNHFGSADAIFCFITPPSSLTHLDQLITHDERRDHSRDSACTFLFYTKFPELLRYGDSSFYIHMIILYQYIGYCVFHRYSASALYRKCLYSLAKTHQIHVKSSKSLSVKCQASKQG